MIRGLILLLGVLLAACAPAPPPSTTVATPAASAPANTAAALSTVAAGPPAPKASTVPADSTAGASAQMALAYSNLITDNLPLWTARETGIFDSHSLLVDLQYIASTNAMAALLAGQVQVASTGGSEVINSIANGADLVVVATLNPV